MEAMITLMNALCAHLGLPSGSFFGNWPESNGVRDFVLLVAGAPVELIQDDLITTPLLPRWQSPNRSAIFGPRFEPDSQSEQDTALLSVEETQKNLVGLEESFRNAVVWKYHQNRLLRLINEARDVSGYPKLQQRTFTVWLNRLEKRRKLSDVS